MLQDGSKMCVHQGSVWRESGLVSQILPLPALWDSQAELMVEDQEAHSPWLLGPELLLQGGGFGKDSS